MALIVIQSNGVYRHKRTELEPLVRDLGCISASFRVRVAGQGPRRYGVTPDIIRELLHVWIPEGSKYLAGLVVQVILKLAIRRVRDSRNRRVCVDIHGPDGRVIKRVYVDKAINPLESEPDPERTPTKQRPQVRE
jgi:hypothetical protein